MKSNAVIHTPVVWPDRGSLLEIEPDASEPRFEKGGYLHVFTDTDAQAGDIVLAGYGDNLVKLRRRVIEDGQRYLLPVADNDPCPSVIDERELRVFGVVRSLTTNL